MKVQSTDSGSGPPSTEDRELVQSFLRHREERVFRTLYRRHTPTLYQVALRFVRGDRGDAEEVLQTAWIRAVENLPGFRWDSSLRSWLTGIVCNCARENLRRRNRDRCMDAAELPDASALPRISSDVRRIDIEKAISELPDGYREVLVLHDIEGYTHLEIGRLLGIETGTSKSQLSRARRTVRARLLQLGKLGHA